MTEIVTRRLILRRCTPSDRPDFLALERDAEVMKYLYGGPVDHARVDLTGIDFLMPRGTEPFVWSAKCKDDGQFAGWFSLAPKNHGVAELGYRLPKVAWGRGIATEGAVALVKWAFENAVYDTIIAGTMAVNLGSRRVMEKIGMRHVKTEFLEFPDPIPGSEHGEVSYEITRQVWDLHVAELT